MSKKTDDIKTMAAKISAQFDFDYIDAINFATNMRYAVSSKPTKTMWKQIAEMILFYHTIEARDMLKSAYYRSEDEAASDILYDHFNQLDREVERLIIITTGQ
jgi:hypothetical protein